MLPLLAYVAHFAFLRDVWIRTQRAAVARRRATSLATHLTKLKGHQIEVFVSSALSAMFRSSTVGTFLNLYLGHFTKMIPYLPSRA